MNLIEVLSLKFPNVTQPFEFACRVKDDGELEIAHWNVEGVDEPTRDDIEQWKKELDLLYRQKKAVGARAYPGLSEQLDMIYKDKVNGTNLWRDMITEIKDSHPKPTK